MSTLAYTGDSFSLLLIIATLMDYMPKVAAFFSIVWVLIRIYETKTVQCWLNCNKKWEQEDDENGSK